MKLLLISNSTAYGGGYLDYCAPAIRDFLKSRSVERVLFVPYAISDRRGYVDKTRARFEALGFGLDSVHDAPDPVAAVESAQALFVGGGNTFRLIDALWRNQLIEPVRRQVRAGACYVGSSAGSNVACPTIKTTNDMPIVQPPSFEAFHLVPFNINPHYQDPAPGSMHMGETREERIAEFHEENDPPVVGLREGAWLVVEEQTLVLQGSKPARLFRRGEPPAEFAPGSRLDFLLG